MQQTAAIYIHVPFCKSKCRYCSFISASSYEPETMEYIRNLGQINQQLAEMADSVIEVVAGIPIFIKGEKL